LEQLLEIGPSYGIDLPPFGGCARGDNLFAALRPDALWVRIYRAKGEFLDRRHWKCRVRFFSTLRMLRSDNVSAETSL